MSTLYRHYRPQKFLDVFGQNHVKITLQHEILADRPANAYLFCGPRAVGKTTLARILAKTINCENRAENEAEPCNNCSSCLSITAGKNLDVVEIDAASNTGVDNVRENIIAFSRLAPTSAKYKVFIIDEVHMLSISAFNALLKIIEEPPKNVIFILCTTEIQKVPGTVISRCERFDFKRISVKDIVDKLSYIAREEKISIDRDILEAIARHSSGHLRDAESLLGQIFSLGDKKITKEQAELILPHYNSNEALDLLDYLNHKEAAKAVVLINNLVNNGVNVKIFTSEIIELLRKIMLSKLSPELVDNLGLDLGESLEKKLTKISANLTWEEILNFTNRFLAVYNDYRKLSIPQLPLELAVSELCLGFRGNLNQSFNNVSSKFSSPLAESKNSAGSFKSPKTSFSENNFDSFPKKASSKLPQKNSILNGKSQFNLEKNDILKKWPEFLTNIKKYNHSLSFVLQNCQAQEIRDGNLFLVFKYKFHENRINEPETKKIVLKALREVFGENLSFSSRIDKELTLNSNSNLNSENIVQNPFLASQSKKVEDKALDIKANNSVKTSQQKDLVEDLLKTFGGELVN